MIEESKYKIYKYQKFRETYNFGTETELRFAAHTTVLYHEFAYHQMIYFCEITNEFFGQNLSSHDPKIDTYMNKAWSNAYSMYVLLRTVIETTREINNELLGKKAIDQYYEIEIKKIIDIANDAIKHPMFKGENSFAYLPTALGIGPEIDVQKWSDKTELASIVTWSPEKDFYTICNYLEHLAELYSK